MDVEGLGWRGGYLEIQGKKYCHDFVGTYARRRLTILGTKLRYNNSFIVFRATITSFELFITRLSRNVYNVAETCYDGVHNHDEIGVDCGGSCQPCRKYIHRQVNGIEIHVITDICDITIATYSELLFCDMVIS